MTATICPGDGCRRSVGTARRSGWLLPLSGASLSVFGLRRRAQGRRTGRGAVGTRAERGGPGSRRPAAAPERPPAPPRPLPSSQATPVLASCLLPSRSTRSSSSELPKLACQRSPAAPSSLSIASRPTSSLSPPPSQGSPPVPPPRSPGRVQAELEPMPINPVPRRVLCVAEKPSIAKEISRIMSSGQSQSVRRPPALISAPRRPSPSPTARSPSSAD